MIPDQSLESLYWRGKSARALAWAAVWELEMEAMS